MQGGINVRERSRKTPLAVVVAGIAVLAIGLPGVATAATKAATGQGATSIRVVQPNQTKDFPTGQSVGVNPPAGIADPELPPAEEGNGARRVNRSLSRASTAAELAHAPRARALDVVGPQETATSFRGLNFFDQRFANGGNQFSLEPPDQGLCAGAGYVVEVVNDVLQVFNKAGKRLTPVTDLNTFWGYPPQFDRATGLQGPFVTDPSCYFDPENQRFYVIALTLEVDKHTGALLGPNHIDIAASTATAPTGSWTLYHIAVQDDGTQHTPTHVDCPCIGDYPHLGADATGLYITTNEYPLNGGPGEFGNDFNGAQLYAIAKSELAAGGPISVNSFENLTLDDGTPGFTVWPAASPGTASYATGSGGTEYFLSSTGPFEAMGTGVGGSIGIWALTNTSSLGTRSPALLLDSRVLPSNQYLTPPRADQKAGYTPLIDCLNVNCLGEGVIFEQPGPLDANDSRMQQTWYSNGMLWGSLDTAVSLDAGGGFQTKAGVLYFGVTPGATLGASTIAVSGYLGVVNNNLVYPAIALNAKGRGYMAMTLAGFDNYPSASYVSISAAGVGPVTIANAGVGPQDGFSETSTFSPAGFGEPPRPRWGDYGAATLDGTTFWLASEYIAQTCNFPTWLRDTTCGGTRGTLGNWATAVTKIQQ
jgi:hypothetical protein